MVMVKAKLGLHTLCRYLWAARMRTLLRKACVDSNTQEGYPTLDSEVASNFLRKVIHKLTLFDLLRTMPKLMSSMSLV